MPEPLVLIGILSKIAGKWATGKDKKEIALDSMEETVKDLATIIFKSGFSKIKKIWTKDDIPEDDSIARSLRETKLYATNFLMEAVVEKIKFLETLAQPGYSPGTGKSLETAYRKWYADQVIVKKYTPYLPAGEALFSRIEVFLPQKDAKEQVIKAIKEGFLAELVYGLRLQGFDEPIPQEIPAYLYHGWQKDGKLLDWFDLLTLQFDRMLEDPARANVQKAFMHELLADVQSEVRAGFQGIEKQINDLARKTDNRLSGTVLMNSQEVVALLRLKAALEVAVLEKWNTYKIREEIANSENSRENFKAEIQAESEWRQKAESLQKVEEELAGIERFIRDAGNIFARLDPQRGSARLKEAKFLFEMGQFSKVRGILSTDEREKERNLLLTKDEEIQQRKRDFATEDLLHAETILVDFTNPDRYADAFKIFEKSIDTCEYYDNCFIYAYVLQEQNQHMEAITYYQKASRHLGVDEKANYATLLNRLGDSYRYIQQFNQAEECLLKSLAIRRELAMRDANEFEPDVGSTLNNLGNLYRSIQHFQESEDCHREALVFYIDLAKRNSGNFMPDVALSLNNLAILYMTIQQLEQSKEGFRQALDIYHTLAEQYPEIFERHEAMILNNLGTLHHKLGQFERAADHFQSALVIHMKLAERNPDAFEPRVAATLNNLGNLYDNFGQYERAIDHFHAALVIHRKLAKRSPDVFEPDVAMVLNNLGISYRMTEQYKQSEDCYLEALAIHRKLAKENPDAFEPDLAMALNNLGGLYTITQQYQQSENCHLEALAIRRKLAARSPDVYDFDVAAALQNLGALYDLSQQYHRSENIYLEALEVYQKIAELNPDAFEPNVAKMLRNLGLLYTAMQRYQEAEDYYRRALDLDLRLYNENPSRYLQETVKVLLSLTQILLVPVVAKKREAYEYLLITVKIILPYREDNHFDLLLTKTDELLRQLGSSLEEAINEVRKGV